MADIPIGEMSDSELQAIGLDTALTLTVVRKIAADVAFLRSAIEPLLPVAEALRGNGQMDAVRAAGLRRSLRKGMR